MASERIVLVILSLGLCTSVLVAFARQLSGGGSQRRPLYYLVIPGISPLDANIIALLVMTLLISAASVVKYHII